jgi:hypothetical protein
MNIPSKIRAGSTVKWRDDSSTDPFGDSIQSTDGWTLKYYLRTNTASEGATITGTTYQTGWELEIDATTSNAMDAGDWYFTAEFSKGSDKYTHSGQFEVLSSLVYSGTPGAFDGRSQAVKDLEDVEAAIRAISTGRSREYTIGDRTFKSLDLSELRMWRSDLKAIIGREEKAEKIANGLGNPHSMYVRFH